MRIRSLFFATYRELLGTEEMEWELPEGSTVKHLTGLVRERSGDAPLPDSPVVAVNREYAGPDTRLKDGDEVAFIPPVAGG